MSKNLTNLINIIRLSLLLIIKKELKSIIKYLRNTRVIIKK